ncbi:alpha-ketoglutarate-dependent dioxygenase alkB homolog 4 [Condylostylus longicornis]|uniref:alpha-ketoglutarate-dependent dioxygenase alkB homolog 4 n=1 Tax=Condylostylus longicornis TaxID=2530218 RepID=UPI00244E3B04|nr:alpha-ketoglutarate-dependent dioxygenase alkB homolog 4 [Condylostylus longicornis]
MNQIRSCGCKGCRTCLLCEKEYNLNKKGFFEQFQDLNPYSFCPKCNKLYPGWNCFKILEDHPNHSNDGIDFPGMLVQLNFLSVNEGEELTKSLDELPWCDSQSGRRKQNFGPKTNFKKRKLQNGNFNGFPISTKFCQDRFKEIELLKEFQTIEQCTLEYNPDKGASIDPHIDDCWVWGERVVTVNCLGDSVLTLTKYNGDNSKYNLRLVENYQDQLICNLDKAEKLDLYENMVIRIPMPNLSLIVMYGPPRYQFEHCVLREDINERRVCIAYREFTPMYLENGIDSDKGITIINNANEFWNQIDTT